MEKIDAQIVGWIGTITVLSAYLLLSTGRLLGTSWKYQLSQVIVGLAYGYMNYRLEAWPVLPVNFLFIILAIHFIKKDRGRVA